MVLQGLRKRTGKESQGSKEGDYPARVLLMLIIGTIQRRNEHVHCHDAISRDADPATC